jgi:hypothetical protein
VAAGQKVNIEGTAVFQTFDVPPGAHLTMGTPVTLPHVIVPKGTTVTVHGPSVVDGVTLPVGKTLTIHGTGQLDNVVLNKGATVEVTGGQATSGTLQAKTAHANLGTIAPALTIGIPQNPYPFHIKHLVDDAQPKTEGPLHMTVPPAKMDPSTPPSTLPSTPSMLPSTPPSTPSTPPSTLGGLLASLLGGLLASTLVGTAGRERSLRAALCCQSQTMRRARAAPWPRLPPLGAPHGRRLPRMCAGAGVGSALPHGASRASTR